MASITNVFGKMGDVNSLPPREYRMNPRPQSMNKLSDLQQHYLGQVGQIKDTYEFKNIDNNNILGSFRPDNSPNVSKKELSCNYLPDVVQNDNVIKACNVLNQNGKPMSSFEDWLILGGIIISIGLFLRFKDKITL